MRRLVQRIQILAVFIAFSIAVLLSHTKVALAQPTTSPLIQQTALVYQGAFRLPPWTSDSASFGYGGTALAYNPAQNSLFIVGHDWYQKTAEVAIPPIVQSSSL